MKKDELITRLRQAYDELPYHPFRAENTLSHILSELSLNGLESERSSVIDFKSTVNQIDKLLGFEPIPNTFAGLGPVNYINQFRRVKLSYPRGTGKTTFINQYAKYIGKTNHNVLLVSQENFRIRPHVCNVRYCSDNDMTRYIREYRTYDSCSSFFVGMRITALLTDEVNSERVSSYIRFLNTAGVINQRDFFVVEVGTPRS